jgi:hypothetical protein
MDFLDCLFLAFLIACAAAIAIFALIVTWPLSPITAIALYLVAKSNWK